MDKLGLEKQTETAPIPAAAQRLLTQEGYFERFFELVTVSGTYQEAYVKLETEYEQYFGQEKYTSYDSFRNMKRRYLRDLQQKARKI